VVPTFFRQHFVWSGTNIFSSTFFWKVAYNFSTFSINVANIFSSIFLGLLPTIFFNIFRDCCQHFCQHFLEMLEQYFPNKCYYIFQKKIKATFFKIKVEPTFFIKSWTNIFSIFFGKNPTFFLLLPPDRTLIFSTCYKILNQHFNICKKCWTNIQNLKKVRSPPPTPVAGEGSGATANRRQATRRRAPAPMAARAAVARGSTVAAAHAGVRGR
jgi:hypothetical protein